MLDWKIAAAGVVIVIAASSVFLTGSGAGGLFSNVINQIQEWLESSPFGGLFASPLSEEKTVSIILFPSNFTLKPDDSINITADNINIMKFRGEINIDFEKESIEMQESDTNLVMQLPVGAVNISGLKFKHMLVEGMGFRVGNITSNNGSIEIFNFFGSGIINLNTLELKGNLTKLKINTEDETWELT